MLFPLRQPAAMLMHAKIQSMHELNGKALFGQSMFGWLGTLLFPLPVLLGLYGIVMFAVQVVQWLEWRVWTELPVRYLFFYPPLSAAGRPASGLFEFLPGWFRGSAGWLHEPTTWLGLHKAVIWLLNSFSVPTLAVVCAVLLRVLAAGAAHQALD